MTLFARAASDEPVFADVLRQYYGGAEDDATLSRLSDVRSVASRAVPSGAPSPVHASQPGAGRVGAVVAAGDVAEPAAAAPGRAAA